MIDKEKFGAFVAQLRKEKGLTQRELAEKLFLSDKAVSKWERGLSMPDITILTPLAETLDVTVTELLNCQRMEAAPMESEQVEELVQKAIHFRQEEVQVKPWKKPKHWLAFLLTQLLVAGIYGLVMLLHVHLGGDVEEGLQTISVSGPLGVYWLLPLLFGAYFWLIVEEKLPNYYDENRISYYSHNGFKIHLAGVAFNNSNWPHILKAARIWCTVLPLTAPILFVALRLSNLPTHLPVLLYTLATLFVPMIYMGKKYE